MPRKLLSTLQRGKVRLYGNFNTTESVEKGFPDADGVTEIFRMVEIPLYTGFEIETDDAQTIKDRDGRLEVGEIKVILRSRDPQSGKVEQMEIEHDGNTRQNTSKVFNPGELQKMRGGRINSFQFGWIHPKKLGRE